VSHIPDLSGNIQGLKRVSRFIRQQGSLLLGTQGPHKDYESIISNGMQYAQKVEPTHTGFTKHYYLKEGSQTVMTQTLFLSTFSFDEAQEMLSSVGLNYVPQERGNGLFLRFRKE
jgi:hypothetical protein